MVTYVFLQLSWFESVGWELNKEEAVMSQKGPDREGGGGSREGALASRIAFQGIMHDLA